MSKFFLMGMGYVFVLANIYSKMLHVTHHVDLYEYSEPVTLSIEYLKLFLLSFTKLTVKCQFFSFQYKASLSFFFFLSITLMYNLLM